MPKITFARTIGALFASGWLAANAVACDSPVVVPDCSMGACEGRDGGGGRPFDGARIPPGETGSMDAGQSRSLLCGTTGCFPGNPSACGLAPPFDAAQQAYTQTDDGSVSDAAADCDGDAHTGDADPGDGADGGSDGSGGSDAAGIPDSDRRDSSGIPDSTGTPDATADASADAAADVGTTVDSGAPDGGGPIDAAVDVIDTGATDEPRIPQSCYIRPVAGGVLTECAPAGPGAIGSTCRDSSECGALLACVEVDQRSVCRPVSCALPPSCPAKSFYDQAPLRVASVTRNDIKIPVCLPADGCTLLEQPSSCPAGKVCSVVGSEGYTTCLVPGSAKLSEPCDEANRCAEGLLCTRFANQCVKICHVDSRATDCPTGTCQGGNRSLPAGFGICVGETSDGG